MTAYYNEIDPFCAQWLRNLIAAGHIAPGEVDERDIRDVEPESLRGFDQCHFFAGIGIWSHALRTAGWADDRPAWSGSCPCQPFSAAGRGGGVDDERHLWPAFFHLIESRRPDVVFGEQVASKDGLGWSDLVQADCQGAGYAFRAEDICAAGVGAPHIRQRIWFVAFRRRAGVMGDADCGGSSQGRSATEAARHGHPAVADGGVGELADTNGRDTAAERQQRRGEQRQQSQDGIPALLGDALGEGPQERPVAAFEPGALRFQGSALGAASPLRGFWRDADWIYCRDGKYRPVEPGTFPLAHGAAARVGRLRAYGNAIVPQVAEEVIREFMRFAP